MLLNCLLFSSSSLDFPLSFLSHLALNVVILSWSSTVLRHLPPPLFYFILLFIIFCCTGFYLFVLCSSLLFPSSHFAHVNALLCPAVTQVRISSNTERLPPAALTTTLPSIQPPATALLADATLLRLFNAHTLPCINSVLRLWALFWILEL
jgi:hypothetical protein